MDDPYPTAVAPRRRLQFGMKTMLAMMLFGGPLVAGIWMWANRTSDPTKTVPCGGKVTLADGTPVVGAIVAFNGMGPKAFGCTGETASDGTFLLSTFEDDDGAPVGQYTVQITDNAASFFPGIAISPNAPSTSTLTVTVSPDRKKNFFHFVVQ